MHDLIPAAWREPLAPAIESGDFTELVEFVAQQRRDHPGRIYPPAAEVVTALELTPFDEVRAVILGMDPYSRAGLAHGHAFSIRPGTKPFPPSLRNILDEVERDLGERVNRDGSLIPWARNGVLLLNVGMTVRERTPGSHLSKWQFFTDAVIRAVNQKRDPVAFLLWGKEPRRRSTFSISDNIRFSSRPTRQGSRRDSISRDRHRSRRRTRNY